jgi:pimeloyl-ACP methyl ester carboxylesterase
MSRKKQAPPDRLKYIRWVFPKLERISPFLAKKLAIRLFFSPLRFSEPERHRKFRETGKQMETQIGGKKVIYYLWGETGKPVIFAHGWMGRATQFQKFIIRFQEAGFLPIAFDGPAHGLSEGKSTDLHEFAETIGYLTQEFGPSHYVGHSFGGVAGVFAKSHGHELLSLITIGSPTVGEYIVEEFCNRINASEKIGNHFHNYVLEKYGRPFSAASIKEMASKMEAFPFLMIHDVEDEEVPLRHAEENQLRNPWIELEKTNGLGHYKILKNKDVVEVALNFITNVTEDKPES